MGDQFVYDLCIVGAGMFGTAAARHASASAGIKVCLVGPDEPTTEEEYKQREIYSSHYDEGRIYQCGRRNRQLRQLAKLTSKALKELEDKSGIPFCVPVGILVVTKESELDQGKINQEILAETSMKNITSSDYLKEKYSFLKISDEHVYLEDDTDSGYLNPRLMIKAQKKVSLQQGCHIIQDVVNNVSQLKNGTHEISTENSGVILAKRVLICAGGFSNFKNLLVKKLAMTISKEVAAMVRVSPEEAIRLKNMPTMSIHDTIEGMDSSVRGCYILPPVLYPDGHHYIKIGYLGLLADSELESLQEVRDWYNSNGNEENANLLAKYLMKLLPGLVIEDVKSKVCITCFSPSDLPYIDALSQTVTVAAVGNGSGATCCEEVGRLAAVLSVSGRWDSHIPRHFFKAVFTD